MPIVKKIKYIWFLTIKFNVWWKRQIFISNYANKCTIATMTMAMKDIWYMTAYKRICSSDGCQSEAEMFDLRSEGWVRDYCTHKGDESLNNCPRENLCTLCRNHVLGGSIIASTGARRERSWLRQEEWEWQRWLGFILLPCRQMIRDFVFVIFILK